MGTKANFLTGALVVIIWSFFCSAGFGDSFTDQTEGDFEQGVYIDTRWNSLSDWVELSDVSLGTFTSRVFDAGANAQWTNLSWLPEFPSYKQLPDYGQAESGYPIANADMTGNVLLMHMNEQSGPIIDYSGEGNNGTVYGGVTYGADGILNTALSFDGTDDYLETGLNVSETQGSFSVEGWYYSTDDNIPAFSCAQRIVSARQQASSTKWCVALDNNRFALGRNGGAAITGSPNVIDAWHHFALVYNGTTMYGYLDGNLDITETTDLGSANVGMVLISTWRPGDGNPRIFKGAIDEVAIYDRVLSADEVLDHYRRGACRLQFQTRGGGADPPPGDFLGWNGSTDTYWSELTNSTLNPPSFSLGSLNEGRYFQYRAYFESDTDIYSPELVSVTARYCLIPPSPTTTPTPIPSPTPSSSPPPTPHPDPDPL